MSKKINLEDLNQALDIAVQRMVIIKQALGLPFKDFFQEKEWVLATFNDIEPDKNGYFSHSCGFWKIQGEKDEIGMQKIEFLFELNETYNKKED